MKKRVVIIGGGASGLMAGITAARLGAAVTLLEHMDKIGKKILSTGNGRCNLTNLDQKPEYYRSQVPDFSKDALMQFSVEKTLRFFEELGIYPKNRNGYIYPNSDQAVSVLEVLTLEAERLHIEIQCLVQVEFVKKKDGKWQVGTRKDGISKVFPADSVVLAAGSMAAPATGSDGSGYELAKSLGHSLIKPLPALVQLRGKGSFLKTLAGVRSEGRVTIFINGNYASHDLGEIQFTDYGISGIPVFQVSRYVSKALDLGDRVEAEVDFFPKLSEKELSEMLNIRKEQNGYKECGDFLTGLFHKKVGQVLLKQAEISRERQVVGLKAGEVRSLLKAVKQFRIPITAVNPFANAQICCGGVDVCQINPKTMESKIAKGFYFAGEILDVDGICGGYNLQWAWSSGYLAGRSAAEEKRKL